MSKLPRNSSATPYDSVSFRKVGWETFEIPLKRVSRLSGAIEKELFWTQGLPETTVFLRIARYPPSGLESCIYCG